MWSMKYLLILALLSGLLFGFIFGVFVTDETFSKQKHYLAWDYKYSQEQHALKRCLYYWYPGKTDTSHYGHKIICLSKPYPIK